MTEDQSEEPIQPEERIGRIAALATAARSRIAGALLQTPLRRILPKSLPDQGLEVWLKMECCQVSGSFKARGATHFLLKLTEESSPKGVITYSSGNHGRALSEAAAKIGLPAVVVAPSTIDTDAGYYNVRIEHSCASDRCEDYPIYECSYGGDGTVSSTTERSI